MTDIAGAVASLPPDNVVRTAKVAQAEPLKISVAGGTVEDAGSLAFVRQGDTVACIRQGQTWLVLGVIWPAANNIGALSATRGTVNVTVPSGAISHVVAHPELWSAPTPPLFVLANLIAKPANSANWWVAGVTPTTTGFTSAAYGPAPPANMSLTYGYIAVW